jgi:hypothetical protein
MKNTIETMSLAAPTMQEYGKAVHDWTASAALDLKLLVTSAFKLHDYNHPSSLYLDHVLVLDAVYDPEQTSTRKAIRFVEGQLIHRDDLWNSWKAQESTGASHLPPKKEFEYMHSQEGLRSVQSKYFKLADERDRADGTTSVGCSLLVRREKGRMSGFLSLPLAVALRSIESPLADYEEEWFDGFQQNLNAPEIRSAIGHSWSLRIRNLRRGRDLPRSPSQSHNSRSNFLSILFSF